ncbi:hypothetical protein [Rhizobium binae]|uniref:hypothetical protein n=1 Tax=Rhizobium binae TaxID=1138190 RepID=UPI001C8324A2|nr:hypothetical protein [Rhizobium binae]MBX4941148.1 hypothetical protein [Rhizobium binae]
MVELTEGDFADIELAASKAMREWERGYVCQDINVRHHISWWVMREAYALGRKQVLDAITFTTSDGEVVNKYIECTDLREYL